MAVALYLRPFQALQGTPGTIPSTRTNFGSRPTKMSSRPPLHQRQVAHFLCVIGISICAIVFLAFIEFSIFPPTHKRLSPPARQKTRRTSRLDTQPLNRYTQRRKENYAKKTLFAIGGFDGGDHATDAEFYLTKRIDREAQARGHIDGGLAVERVGAVGLNRTRIQYGA